ncbi:hypothetical protein GCM10022252_68430 [Streptosporangium oxazolinicum]|uniref:Uncharacterized protein n=1 Tax=Streptosporangium oxazolinicum TaxID=909287 RepID=A0ABP8BGJ6_9ACTN
MRNSEKDPAALRCRAEQSRTGAATASGATRNAHLRTADELERLAQGAESAT